MPERRLTAEEIQWQLEHLGLGAYCQTYTDAGVQITAMGSLEQWSALLRSPPQQGVMVPIEIDGPSDWTKGKVVARLACGHDEEPWVIEAVANTEQEAVRVLQRLVYPALTTTGTPPQPTE